MTARTRSVVEIGGASSPSETARRSDSRPKLGFINEDVHGHSVIHARLQALVGARQDVDPWFARIPAPNRLEARLLRPTRSFGDLDLQPLRWRLRYSWRTRRVASAHTAADALFVESQACALLAAGLMRRTPWVLSVDATSRQFAELEYWRERDRFSPIGETAIERLERRAYPERAQDRRLERVDRPGAAPLRRRAGAHRSAAPRRARPGEAAHHHFDPRDDLASDAVRRKQRRTQRPAGPARGAADDSLQRSSRRGDRDPVPPAAGVRIHSGVAADSDELQRLYSEVDALVVPTLADCVPLVVVEGMAAGIPVVATDVGAIPELLAAGGLVVPPGDPRALADAIDRLASSPELRARLGQQGHRRARERFDLKLQTDRLVQLLKDSATAGPGPGRDRA